MSARMRLFAAAGLALVVAGCERSGARGEMRVQLGPRPYYLVESMAESELKSALQACSEGPFRSSRFVIGHRGAPMQFPEHTRESYLAAARMGAGVLECDVTFTRDRELVCRHAQCDLQQTTNILAIPELAAKCSEPFTPADPASDEPASARCCTSDITLAEFKSLCGKMDGVDPGATTVEDYLRGTPGWRTDLYASCGTLLSHAESIELFTSLGVAFAPELKEPQVKMPFQGEYTRDMYAQQLADEYAKAGVDPARVWPQSFDLDFLRYWLERTPRFGEQAVLLDYRAFTDPDFTPTLAEMQKLRDLGVRYIAPPTWVLVTLDAEGRIVASEYGELAHRAGLDIIAWTLERSPPLSSGGDWYYQSIDAAVERDGDVYELLDVLAREVGVRAVFSDWPATATYYASCMDID